MGTWWRPEPDLMLAIVITVVFWIGVLTSVALKGPLRVIGVIAAVIAFVLHPIGVLGVTFGIVVLYLFFRFFGV